MSKDKQLPKFEYDGKSHEASTLTDEELRSSIAKAAYRGSQFPYPCGERSAAELDIDLLTAEVRFRANDVEKAKQELEEM